jgi:CarD family transcriptional regulator
MYSGTTESKSETVDMNRKKPSGKMPTKKAKPAAHKVAARATVPSKGAVREAQPSKAQAKRAVKTTAKRLQQIKAAAASSKPAKPAATVKAPKAPIQKLGGSKPIMVAPSQVRPPAGASARTIAAAAGKGSALKITAPPAQQASAPKAATQLPGQGSKKPVHQRHGFKVNEWIVYPAHGVGRIVGIEEQEIAGISLELFVITFEKDKMTLRVPTGKSQSVGMRKLAEEGSVKRAMETLKGKARIKRTMWSRRAQEYEAKINSGDLISIAEVVRDLYRSESQPEQSYSERQLYEAALDRMAREIAAVEKLDERGAVQRITEVLAKSAKGRRLAAEEAEVKAA